MKEYLNVELLNGTLKIIRGLGMGKYLVDESGKVISGGYLWNGIFSLDS